LWLAVLAVLAVAVVHSLKLSTDLRLFLPKAASTEQALVLEGIGEGPAARLLIIALDGGDPAELAAESHALVAALRADSNFRIVTNGSGDIPAWLIGHRYLLTRSFDARPLDADYLRASLQDRLQDLASPAAPALEALIPSDPTLEVASIASAWASRRSPRTIDGAWFDAAGSRALLLAETRAAGFDPDGQEQAIAALDAAFGAVNADPQVHMTVTGPGWFSAMMKERTQRETTRLGTAATAGLIVLLMIAYRRWRVPLLAPLPLATGALSGLAAVGALYGEVHGITLAFGFTLIGVAQDYPVHLFSHQRPGVPPATNAALLWPTLGTGIAATCIAYVAFLASGVTGLAQLGVFSIIGLAIAGLTTRFLLPRMTGDDFRDPARSKALAVLDRTLSMPRLPPVAYVAAVAACIAVAAWAPGAAWQDDLGALAPVPADLLAKDARLRAEIGAPDPRYLAVVTASDAESVLRRLEALTPDLDGLVRAGAVAGYEHAAKYLPSGQRQRMRQLRLPGPGELRAALATALKGTPFRTGVFNAFLADVERARTQPPLTLGALQGTAQAALVEGLVQEKRDSARGIIAFAGVADPGRLRGWASAAGVGTVFIDLKSEASALVVNQRQRILLCLAIAAALLVIVVRVALGGWLRVARVMAPMVLTTAAIVALFRALAVPLDLFHLMSLVLAAGLGIDYALFFERTREDRDERLRTLHAVLVSSVSTLMVFALLSMSDIPVLRSIGITVTLGVILNFMLALSQPRIRATPA
jgi:predicted exporter